MQPIRIDRLGKKFADVTAVDELSLSVSEGEIFGLVGPDGAGKTTTMRLLTGILEPTSGTAYVADFDIASQAERVKEHIGYVSQRFGLYADLTVSENVDFYADIYQVSRKERAERSKRLLEFSNLAAFQRRRAGDLSGGMKQKLALTCALIHTPSVLILDEPTSGVDPVSRRDFWRLLYQLLRQKVTIFISTAYLDEAERCSRVGLLDRGRLLVQGTPDEVKQFMRAAVLEVRTSSPRQAAMLLRRELAGTIVNLFADRVHVVSDQAQETERRIAEILKANGLEVEQIKEVEPSLEDVFIWAVGTAREGSA